MRLKRWIAGLLCISLLGTTDAMTLQAASLGTVEEEQTKQVQEETQVEEQELSSEEKEESDTGKTASDQQEQAVEAGDLQNTDEETKETENTENTEKEAVKEPEESKDNAQEPSQAQEAPRISYAVIDQPYLTTPGSQDVVVGIGDDDVSLEKAVLEYKNRTTGESAFTEAKEIAGNAALFHMEFEDESRSGIYELTAITYTVGQIEYQTAFAEAGMEMLFGVNEEADSNPDGVVVEEEQDVDIDVVTIDENGNTTSKNDISEAIEEVQSESTIQRQSGTVYGSKSGNVVVLLDPGHDANHPGASYNGLVEKDINFKIAQYCKAELETYAGVTVQMTRSSDACPYGTANAATCNAQRVEHAKRIGADIYVSIHNNASGVGATGSEVYYPNGNYNAQVSAEGKDAAEKILNKLAELGLKNRGVKIRNSANGTVYPDGNIADYYGVIKNCKYAGIPAIIVEHAFMDSSDAANFLNSDDKLQRLGIADATGIAQHFGLKKKPTGPPPAKPGKTTITIAKSVENTTINLQWKKVKNASGYLIYRSTKKDSGYQKVATIGSGSTTSYKDKGIKADKNYYYKIKVRATANDQHSYSSYSAVMRGRTVSCPSISSIKSNADKELKISWKKKSGANGYYIYRSTKKDSGYKKIATIGNGNTTSYSDKKISTGKTYYYKIRSRNKIDGSSGYSSYSGIVSGRTVKSPVISGVKSTGNTKLEVSWKKVSGANGYYVYRSTKKNSGYKKIATIGSGNTTKYTDKSVKKQTGYYYRVKSRNKVNKVTGYSSLSKAVLGKTVTAPQISSVISRSRTSLEVNWDKVDGANGYYIYRSTQKDSGYEKIATVSGKNTTSYRDTKRKVGQKYYYKVKSRNKLTGPSGYSNYSGAVYGKTVAKTEITSLKVSGSKVSIKWKKVSGASGYLIKKTAVKNGTYRVVTKIQKGSQTSYSDADIEIGKTYYYVVEAMNTVNGNTGYSGYSAVESVTYGSLIMGASEVTADQMTAYYNRSGKTYPASVYSSKGAANIKEFCNIVVQEAAAEGVRADVVFAQICNETGFLQFGGDVQPQQCNFAGLGATGNGVCGESFPNVRTGVRAQVQHLKAYASTDPLNQTCVDNRFAYVARGCAPYVEWLGMQENPSGKGWAAAKNYGYTLMSMVRTMQTM